MQRTESDGLTHRRPPIWQSDGSSVPRAASCSSPRALAPMVGHHRHGESELLGRRRGILGGPLRQPGGDGVPRHPVVGGIDVVDAEPRRQQVEVVETGKAHRQPAVGGGQQPARAAGA